MLVAVLGTMNEVSLSAEIVLELVPYLQHAHREELCHVEEVGIDGGVISQLVGENRAHAVRRIVEKIKKSLCIGKTLRIGLAGARVLVAGGVHRHEHCLTNALIECEEVDFARHRINVGTEVFLCCCQLRSAQIERTGRGEYFEIGRPQRLFGDV